MIKTLPLQIRKFANRMADDVRGIAAVEFAYIAPIMLVMLIGTVEVANAVSADRRFGLVTAMVADLVARETTMTAADLNGIYLIAQHIVGDANQASLKMAVIPVKANPANKDQVKVYAATTNRPSLNGYTQPAKCAAYTMTSDLLSAGSSAIVVESSFTYDPILANGFIGNVTWTDKAVLSPRNSCVDFDADNCVSTCF